MTDPKGRYFISYRRSPGRPNGTDEAIKVRDALRDRGAPTWRDLDDLASEPTEDEIIKTLDDPNTAGAIMLVSPEVKDSGMIRIVEAPRIFKRYGKEKGFLVKPVLIGLGYDKAKEVLDNPAGFQNLADWNLCKVDNDHLTEADANMIARSMLKYRLKLISETAPNEPLDIALFSRRTGGPGPYALRHDFSPYFDGRVPRDGGVYRRIQSALLDTAGILTSVLNDIPIVGQGSAALPLGVLYGAVFSPLAGFRVSWLQRLDGREDAWSLSSGQSNLRLSAEITKGDLESRDIVLAMSISADTQTAVSEYMENSDLRPRASIHAMLETGPVPQGVALSSQDGLSIVLQAIEAARNLKDDLGLRRARLHLFLSCPLAMAVILGQKLNTFSECALYEHHAEGKPSYLHVHTFNPSNLSLSGDGL